MKVDGRVQCRDNWKEATIVMVTTRTNSCSTIALGRDQSGSSTAIPDVFVEKGAVFQKLASHSTGLNG